MNKDHMAGFGIGLLAGALIGGVIALLYAPASGRETRQVIKEKTSDMAEGIKLKASDIAEGIKDRASTFAGDVKHKANGVIHAIKE